MVRRKEAKKGKEKKNDQIRSQGVQFRRPCRTSQAAHLALKTYSFLWAHVEQWLLAQEFSEGLNFQKRVLFCSQNSVHVMYIPLLSLGQCTGR
jgi:hypothetical protein